MKDLPKICADSLRTFSKDKYEIKLKAAHAHELVAAYLGYKSKNGLLADKEYPVSDLSQCEIIVMMPDDFIDQRRKSLSDLPLGLPDSYTLGEAVYGALFDDAWWLSPYPPFKNYDKMARYLVENNDAYKAVFNLSRDIPVHHFVRVENLENNTFITVIHANKTSNGEMLGNGKTSINLPRVAGRVGFGSPEVYVEKWTAGARRTLDSLGMLA